MIISDLEHFELASDENSVEGGSFPSHESFSVDICSNPFIKGNVAKSESNAIAYGKNTFTLTQQEAYVGYGYSSSSGLAVAAASSY
ncbi:MAG: hypothetical protein KME60_22155 [Cyanomargarita calcarea GSE-NOS-MK-12-04C]|jgi:hypothetical protein|uniref:Uncharacterized protein n=1 Tax=Cyanomargarita calcarea GSE-NOS-MK-12-04C TaxID=2839659 RepID=A0A951QQ45_9CYAN|nr:hypothetical protein [Cyanomargarita calcarea GSE-NOS-MK-12-04C]